MPTYEYKCAECESVWSEDHKITELQKLRTCPACGSKDVVRLIPSGTGFVLKGSGWARDRYKG